MFLNIIIRYHRKNNCEFIFKARSGSRVRRCQHNATIVHVCMAVNAKKIGIGISVNANTPAFLEQPVEMVTRNAICFMLKSLKMLKSFLTGLIKRYIFINCSCGNSEIPRKQLNEPKI